MAFCYGSPSRATPSLIHPVWLFGLPSSSVSLLSNLSASSWDQLPSQLRARESLSQSLYLGQSRLILLSTLYLAALRAFVLEGSPWGQNREKTGKHGTLLIRGNDAEPIMSLLD